MNTISYAKVAPCFYVLPVLLAERVQKGEVKECVEGTQVFISNHNHIHTSDALTGTRVVLCAVERRTRRCALNRRRKKSTDFNEKGFC